MDAKELQAAQARCHEINTRFGASRVQVRGLEGEEVLFECTGPECHQCSVLVRQPDGTNKRVFALLADVTFPGSAG